MTIISVRRDGMALVPHSRAAAMEIEKLKSGVLIRADIRRPRNGKCHRLFYAMATLVADALNDGPAPKAKGWDQVDVVELFKIGSGHFDYLPLPKQRQKNGVTHFVRLRSISFAKMDQDEFGRLMDASFMYVRDEIAPWIEDSDHWPNIRQILADSRLVEKEAFA